MYICSYNFYELYRCHKSSIFNNISWIWCAFLNQACTGHRPACAWFLKIVSVQMFVCVSVPRLLITSDVIWTSYNWLNKCYSCYMATVVVIVNGVALALVCVMETNPIRIN